ncbi:hypothetical protein DSECCO2_557830 [anaerobic digester metagenome]
MLSFKIPQPARTMKTATTTAAIRSRGMPKNCPRSAKNTTEEERTSTRCCLPSAIRLGELYFRPTFTS